MEDSWIDVLSLSSLSSFHSLDENLIPGFCFPSWISSAFPLTLARYLRILPDYAHIGLLSHQTSLELSEPFFDKKLLIVNFFWQCPTACGILIPWPGIKTSSPAVEAQSLRRLLRAPWTARRSNQSVIKEITLEYLLEGLLLKLKLQYFGHLVRKAKSLEKMMLGKIEGKRRSR